MAKSDGDSGSDFKSALKAPAERFLSQAVAHALERGYRTPDDFLRQFKPADLMLGLEGAPELRAKLLIEGAGVHEKIARKKSTTSAGEDLKLALDEGVTSSAQLLELLPPDERVRYLDRKKLWAFTVEDEFWSPLNAGADVERTLSRVVFLIENALGENLLTLQGLTDAVTFESISTRLPNKELQKIARHALKLGRDKKPLNETELLECVPLKSLLGYLPLDHVFNSVIVERVAKPAGFVGAAAGEAARGADAATAQKELPKSVPPPPKNVLPVQATEAKAGADDDVDQLIQSTRPPAEEDARRRVIDKLTGINRLPPRHESLTTPILLSIESMYSELLSASTDDAREMCIRDSFPNQQQLTIALLALIELLDASIDVNDPVIKDADVDSLVKVVLFEERHRYEQDHPAARSVPSSPSPLPPPVAGRKASIAPPPLPRQAVLQPPASDAKRAR